MFTKVAVEGFKSFRDRTEVELRRLTLLAGANNTGKSSLIQPLLLLKQTLLSDADAGPLRLDGPNVIFNRKDQMFWSMPGEERSNRLQIGVWANHSRRMWISGVEISLQNPGPESQLKLEKCTWFSGKDRLELDAGDSPSTLKQKMKNTALFRKMIGFFFRYGHFEPEIAREGPFLDIRFRGNKGKSHAGPTLAGLASQPITLELRRLIHVPGVRGNPQRSYPILAVGPTFRGLFHEYVASLIEQWEKERAGRNGKPGSEDKLKILMGWLKQLGLTRKVGTRRWSEIQLEIRVARTVRGRRGWGRDMVSIADAGFGLSQSLPVVAALLAAENGQAVYVEQPEIHLHPDAQVGLAAVMAQALKRGIQIIAETHSPLLLLGIQKEIASGNLSPDDVVLHWFERDKDGASHVHSTGFHRDGSYENPEIPVDFSDVSMKLMREFLSAAASVTS